MKEQWRPMYGYEDMYEISDHGRVWSKINGRLLKPYVNDNGYRVVRIGHKSKSKVLRVHRLMMLTFVGPDPIRRVVNHKDGDKLNNTLPNLEWMTSSENNQHAIDTGLRTYEKIKVEYHVTIGDLDFTVKGAKHAAKRLHSEGYFTDVSEDSLKAAVSQCAIEHRLYLGVLKIERTNDRFDDIPEYHRCGIKGRPIRAYLPNGETIEAKGPSKLVDLARSMGFWTETDRSSMVKLVSGAAIEGYKCYGIKVWYVDSD